MLNSIQKQSNAAPAFGCSKCNKGTTIIKDLIRNGANHILATEYVDRFAPAMGKEVKDSLTGRTMKIGHGDLLNTLSEQLQSLLEMGYGRFRH